MIKPLRSRRGFTLIELLVDIAGIEPVAACDDSCSFGTTTTPSTVQVTTGSTGLFTWWRSYGISSCADGTSNTIAFAETRVGDGSMANFSASSGISSEISSYDAFVTAQAGGAAYDGMTVSWQAIGSTATVNAVDHIGSSTAGVF
jgi:hypothetical protein